MCREKGVCRRPQRGRLLWDSMYAVSTSAPIDSDLFRFTPHFYTAPCPDGALAPGGLTMARKSAPVAQYNSDAPRKYVRPHNARPVGRAAGNQFNPLGKLRARPVAKSVAPRGECREAGRFRCDPDKGRVFIKLIRNLADFTLSSSLFPTQIHSIRS